MAEIKMNQRVSRVPDSSMSVCNKRPSKIVFRVYTLVRVDGYY